MAVYLSKLILNTGDLRALRALTNGYEMHRFIWSAFPYAEDGGPGRVLFRTEPFVPGREVIVLVQSEKEPDWHLHVHDGLLERYDRKEFTPKLLVGQILRFRLRANPTARKPAGAQQSVRVGLFGEERQRVWLERKAEAGGFKLLDCRIEGCGNTDSRKPGAKDSIRHLGVDFEGTLEVTDSGLFLKTLESGIGSAKGFGFGLLSVAPVRKLDDNG